MGKEVVSTPTQVANVSANNQSNKVNTQADDVRDILNSVNPNIPVNNQPQTGYVPAPNNRPMQQKNNQGPMRNSNVRIISNGAQNHAMAQNPNMNRQMAPNRNINGNFAAQNNQPMAKFVFLNNLWE
jgi:hypothetical protein